MVKDRIKHIFQGVGGAALIVVVAQVLSKGTGFFREILFAGKFGVGKDFEYFLIAYTIPAMLNSILFYQAQNYFIPIYNDLKSEDPEEANSFFVSTMLLFTGLVTLVAVGLNFTSDGVISLFLDNSTGSDHTAINQLFEMALLTVPLNAIISILSAYLIAEFKFKVTYLSQVWTNLSIIFTVFFFSAWLGTMAIIAGYIMGSMIQVTHLLFGSKNMFRGKFKFSLAISKNVSWLIFLNTLFVEVTGQIFFFIDRLFYTNTEPGGIASLNYSYIIYMLPVTIFTTALGSALLPDFAANVAKGDLKEANAKFTKAIEVILLVFIPASVIFIFAGGEIIGLLYQRGKFTGDSTLLTEGTLFYYALSLPLYAIFAVGLKYAYSLKGSTALVLISLSGLILKYILSLVLSENMHQNGLALSTSITYIVQSVLCLTFIIKRSGFKLNPELVKNGFFFMIYSSMILFVCHLLVSQFNLTTLILPLCFILAYPLILHITRNSVYEEIVSRFLKSRQ